MLVYLYGCTKQGQWLRLDSAMQVDTSCKKLLYVWTPELLSFHVNAIHDQLPSPSKTNLGSCHLCHHNNCTLFHILNGCNFSLQSGRYNWRHDQTLKAVANGIMPFIEEANQKSYTPPEDTNYMTTVKFRNADGVTYRNPALPLPKRDPTNLLQKANDWEFLMDEEHKQVVFPPIITETAKRPDITIYSERTKTVLLSSLSLQSQWKKTCHMPMQERKANTKIL
ncbi:uncharacterized protein [Amphiura filiformis]|uniref:uncharacterized protein n=1 Tax=Amphiura filiformis TaxID=82378 RepID=UPI003B2106DC